MLFSKRSAGVFLHPTSLPSRFGIGDFGESAYRFVDTLAAHKQVYWQMCPLGPTGQGDSPYQSLSSFAGNTALIAPDVLIGDGLLRDEDLLAYPQLNENSVDYEAVRREKDILLRLAFSRFKQSDDFRAFCKRNKDWLDDFVLYVAIKEKQGGKPWYTWDKALRGRKPAQLASAAAAMGDTLTYYKFLQFVFFRQWLSLRRYANERGVKIIGDVPYYAAYDSADTWTSPELFDLDSEGGCRAIAGVPPDYFSATGQLWGNPLYNWAKMADNKYAWWTMRLRKNLDLYDIVRIDHFRAFSSYWSVPAGSENAIGGKWVKGPGMAFFDILKEQLGGLPFIAEDLGLIDDAVRELISTTGLPGMKILQFAFDWDSNNLYLPFNISKNSVAYTGTHDNNTSLGWYQSISEDNRGYVRTYMACSDDAFLDYFLRLAYGSPADLCIVPLQDILGLDGMHRFNVPGTPEGNWRWRFRPDMVQPWMFERAKRYTELYGRRR